MSYPVKPQAQNQSHSKCVKPAKETTESENKKIYQVAIITSINVQPYEITATSIEDAKERAEKDGQELVDDSYPVCELRNPLDLWQPLFIDIIKSRTVENGSIDEVIETVFSQLN